MLYQDGYCRSYVYVGGIVQRAKSNKHSTDAKSRA